MMCMNDFTSSIKKASKVDPAIERWFHGTRELERESSERVVYLCSYFDRIPVQSQPEYADILFQTLRSNDSRERPFVSDRMRENIRKFAAHLEKSGDAVKVEKARLLREAIQTSSCTTSEDS